MVVTAETYSVTQMARKLGKSANTVRQWTREFTDYLSPSAMPPKGETRYYTTDDLQVFQTVLVLRDQHKPYEVIHQALSRGERYEPAEPPEQPESPTESSIPPVDTQTKDLAALDLLERFAMPMIDSLQQQLDTERQARIDAEVGAARLAGQLDAVYRRNWWQVWRPERPENTANE